MSSSGVVVVSLPSLRAFQLIGKVPRWDDENATVPDPSMSDPVQVLAASLVTGMIPPVLALRAQRRLVASLPSGGGAGNSLRRRQACR
ncbi:hypothetical protein MOX01_24650 [Microbacterium oxydans]|nr:hypothetical protein MOX01_24650 [Microbacterium oxydans]